MKAFYYLIKYGIITKYICDYCHLLSYWQLFAEKGSEKMNVAILGYGVVGSGVYEILKNTAETVAKNAGKTVEVKYILDIRDFENHPEIQAGSSYTYGYIGGSRCNPFLCFKHRALCSLKVRRNMLFSRLQRTFSPASIHAFPWRNQPFKVEILYRKACEWSFGLLCWRGSCSYFRAINLLFKMLFLKANYTAMINFIPARAAFLTCRFYKKMPLQTK